MSAAGSFLALALLSAFGGVLPGEVLLHDQLLSVSPPLLVSLMGWVTRLGDRVFLVPAVIALLIALPRRLRPYWWVWVVLMIVAPLGEGVWKEVVARPRPTGGSYGFPSGHAAAATAFFGTAAYVVTRAATSRVLKLAVWPGAWGIIGLVAASRILLNAHWLSDAVGGMLLGATCFSGAIAWVEHRESLTGNRASGIGHRESRIPNPESRSPDLPTS